MSSCLQEFLNYHRAVLENERLYWSIVGKRSGVVSSSTDSGIDVLYLQKQVAQLSSDLQASKQENEEMQELHKRQRTSMEKKLKSSKKLLDKLRCQLKDGSEQPDLHIVTGIPDAKLVSKFKSNDENNLLSPIFGGVNEHGKRTRRFNVDDTDVRLRTNFKRERHDVAADDATTKAQNVSNSLKQNNKLLNLQLPPTDLSDTPDLDTSAPPSRKEELPNDGIKKRKLASKKIQHIESDDSIL